jgi:hypothetical protein
MIFMKGIGHSCLLEVSLLREKKMLFADLEMPKSRRENRIPQAVSA